MTKSKQEIPNIGIGTWKYQGDDCVQSVYQALQIGYRHIDCAFSYGNQDFVGKAIKQFLNENTHVKRSDLFITCKLWNSQHDDVEAAVMTCLEELGTDYLDLYIIHWPVYYQIPNTPINWSAAKNNQQSLKDAKYPKNPNTGLFYEKEFSVAHLSKVWKEMEGLVRKGIVKRIGVSNFGLRLIQQLLNIAVIKPCCNQIECHPHLQQKEMKAVLDKEEIALVSYSPLGGGDMSFMDDEKIKNAANKIGCTPSQFMLAWNLAQRNVIIPRSKQYKNLKNNFESQSFVEKIKNDKELLNIDLDKEIRTNSPLWISKNGLEEKNLKFWD
eukprot:GAHX01000033.1.p1 GENE.GAHX01000033.1~~GAHX01000033.1.p1  ORF type:complete len:341 (+),score=70.20 GAHX01000033.1:46-1023(+)